MSLHRSALAVSLSQARGPRRASGHFLECDFFKLGGGGGWFSGLRGVGGIVLWLGGGFFWEYYFIKGGGGGVGVHVCSV